MFRRQRTRYYYPRDTYRRDRRALAAPRRRRRKTISRLLGEFLSWFFFLVLCSGAVIGGLMYVVHTKFDDAARRHVEAKLRQTFPQHQVTLQAVRRIEGRGIELRGLTIADAAPDAQPEPIIAIEEMLLECNVAIEDLLAGNLSAKRFVVSRLHIHAKRAKDGLWNWQHLLPLPKMGTQQVPIEIDNSTAEIHLAEGDGAKPLSVVVQQLRLTPQIDAAAGATAPARVWSFDGTFGGSHLTQLAVQGEIDIAVQAWQASGEMRGLQIRNDLVPCLPPEFREYSQLCDVLELSVDATFQATNQNADGRWCRFTVQGQIQGRVEDKRLPLQLSDLLAKFSSDGRSLTVEQMSARAGQAQLTGSCRLEGFFEDAPCSLKLTAQQLLVDQRFVEGLPEQWRAMWGKVDPSGLIDAQVGLEFDGRTIKHRADVTCHNVSFAYHRFPYRLSHGQGQVVWQNGTLTFQNFVASANGKPVYLTGEIKDPGPNYTGYVDVRADEPLAVDGLLIAALPETARRVVNQLNPQGGLVTVRGRFERQGANPPIAKKELRIQIHQCAVNYDLFPYPLSKIHGNITMKDDHWSLSDLVGVNDSAWVNCNGSWGPDLNEPVRLTFNANDVPLVDALRNALRPESQAVWNSLQPRGALDHLKAQVEYNRQTRKTTVDVTASKQAASGNVAGRTITIKPTWLPYQLEDVQGNLRFQNGITTFQGIRGTHGNMLLALLEGEASTNPEGTWQVRINDLEVDRLEVTRELLTALPPRLSGAVGRLNLAGPLNMNGTMIIEGDRGNLTPKATQWDLDFDIEGGSLNCGLRLDRIHGGMNLVGTSNAQGFVSRGDLDIDSVFFHGIQFTQVQGPISIDDQRLRLGEWVAAQQPNTPSPSIRGRLFGGDLRADGELLLTGDHPFRIKSQLFNADLSMISRESSSRRADLSGLTFANLRLDGTCKGTHTFTGSGDVQLRKADIYELPVMMDMLKLLQIKQPDGTAFTSSDVKYHIEGDQIYFDEIAFDGDVINLTGKGDMTLDRNLNLTFTTSLASNGFSILRPLFKKVGEQLVEIRVTGTLDNPLVTQLPLPNIPLNMESIWGPAPNSSSAPAMSRLPKPEALNRPTPQR